MKLVAPAIKRYRLTILGVLLLIILGTLTYMIIPRQEDPVVKAPGTTVMVHYPGAGPRDIEQYIIRPVEEKIHEIQDVEQIIATASQGAAFILIRFDPDSNLDQSIQTLREKVREVEKDLPEESMDPEIMRWETETVSMVINLSGPLNNREIHEYAKLIKRDLENIPGIMRLEIQGNQEREVHVEVNPNRLSLFNISLNDLISRIKAENISLPGGHMDVGRKSYLVRTDEQYKGVDEIGKTIIGSYDGRPIFLRDVAVIKDAYERPEYLIRFNGIEGINILVTTKPKSSQNVVSQEIRSRVEILQKRLSPQLHLAIFSDHAISVSERLSVFQNNLLMGAGLVILATMLMMNLRMAFIVAVLIPLSIAFSVIMLYRFGHSLNQVTLASMVIVLGMLVDNGIVVVENIQRHMGLKKDRMSAALDGSGEVLGAITSSTLTTVLAFTPLLFMVGDIGQFIRGIPLTMIFALTGSLLVAIFVSPLLSYRFLKENNQKEAEEKRIIRIYTHILRWTLHHKALILIMALIALLGTLALIPRLGLQFFPKAEKDLFIIDVSLPSGTNMETTLDLAKKIEKHLMNEQEIADVMTHVGGNGARIYYNVNYFQTRATNRVQFFVTVKPGSGNGRAADIIKRLRPKFHRIAGAEIEFQELEQGPPVGAPIAVKIRGDDLEVLKDLALQYRSILETIPGAVDVWDDASRSIPQVRITVDADRARMLEITNASIAQAMRTAIYGTTAGAITLEDEEVDIIVSLEEKARDTLAMFDEIYLKSMTGAKIPFKQVAHLDLSFDIGSITREDLTRTVTVRSGAQGVLTETIVDALKRKTAGITIPPGYLVEYEGETKERTESFISLGWAMIAAFLLVYTVLVAQFNSFKQPFIIALSLPFGLVGATLGLWITGYPFSFVAFLGVVSLTGIVVNDAIVLIDFINVTRKTETDVVKAVIEAGKVRFRPVMLTTISTVGGLLPLAIRGGSLWGPMGNVIIFGLSSATILTLIIIPVVYVVLEQGR
ncbi:MAG: efflux RND transporter permease subunit [Deltaproteobacteria bacterium]|nr:efflux RND transporter permease subunit [Deltaproteobacteria bacterium]